jgi:hypothetical protein
MIISIHIPKTAGTTLANYLDYSFGRRVFFDYYEDIPYKTDRETIIRHKEFVERFEVIHGHFIYKKYENIFPDAKYITCLRHPVDRLISNYRHVMSLKDESKASYRYMMKHGFDIVTFAETKMAHTLTIFLEGKPIQEYDFIGLSEQFDVTLAMMSKFLGRNLFLPTVDNTGKGMGPLRYLCYRFAVGKRAVKVPKLNIQDPLTAFTLTKAEREKVGTLLKDDIALYAQGVERFNELKQQLLGGD